MVTDPLQPDNIDHLLHIVNLSLIDVRDIASDWDKINIGIKMGWEQEWRNYMHMFERLNHTYRTGRMNDDQQSRFLTLQHDLEQSAALIESLGLRRPPVLSGT